MSKSNWDATNIPDQKDRVAIITGATSGLGKEAARILAGKNSSVIMAVRNVKKGEGVAAEIRKNFPDADVTVREIDLTSLSSVKNFSDRFAEDYDRLDNLINNAGIMFCPYSKTRDGFEVQMGTNHLGHFALTGHLMPLLKKTEGSRIVATSSMAHKTGNIDFSDINWEKRNYKKLQAYADSKIANLYFTYELARKFQNDANAPKVTAAHPGWTGTDLQRHSGIMKFLNTFFSQGTDMGALPTLRAAIDPDAEPGDYFGPSKFFEMHGHPVKVKSNKRSHDEQAAGQLWELSEKLTGVEY
jgi:NAD(P)-dependent dehydrogenase (short-subunit alcohol dehydrogenase family)